MNVILLSFCKTISTHMRHEIQCASYIDIDYIDNRIHNNISHPIID